jgi:translation initiation factor 3 subunit B
MSRSSRERTSRFSEESDDGPSGGAGDAFEDEEPQMDTSLKQIIIVDGLPIVPAEKHEKLTNVIRKFFSQVGTIVENGLEMPKDEKGTSKGFAFIEFSSVAEATAAIQKANGYKLDKSHTFIVNSFEDHAKFMSVPDEEVEFVPPPFVPKEDLRDWLSDPGARDQYVVRYNEETEIWWNEATKPSMDPEYSRRNWTENYTQWSPRGTFLATFHRLGIMLWGGKSWKKLLKVSHGGVRLMDFSPNERFLVTWSPEADQTQALVVWDVKTGKQLRAFQGTRDGEDIGDWPVLRWSHDDQFFARLGDDCIFVYESSTMKLTKDKQDKRTSVHIDGVRQFLWSPTDNIMSLWIPEHQNQPAKVCLMEMPSRNELRQKNLFNVADLRMTWHDQGHFLCVKVDKHSKSKKTLNSEFELFRMRDKNVPIEVLEFSKDSSVLAFGWENKGIRFGIIHTEGQSNRTDVSFYSMGSKYNGKISLLKTLEKKPATLLFWSPAGSIVLMANLKGTSGQLEWFDVNAMQTIGEAEHFMCSDIEWDPTGRFVATSVSHWRHQMENGYNIWTSQGRQLKHQRQDKFYQLLWRPRPPSLLSVAQEKDVRKNLRSFSAKYEAEDAMARSGMQGEAKIICQQKSAAFEEWLKLKDDEYKAQRQTRIDMRGGLESDNESAYTLVEDVDEVEISYKEDCVDVGGPRDSD